MLLFSRMRSTGFSFNFGSLRVELCSPVVVFVTATVRNRSHVFAIVRIRLLWPCRWGELEKVTFDGCVTCQFAPLFHCDLHESGMSCKKGDAFRCTGAGFRESDTFAS